MAIFRRGKRTDLRGRWSDVFVTLVTVLLIYLTLRWATFEPFVIPSGSMKPTLLVQDYVLVKKWAYGLRIPTSENWFFGPVVPKRGDIVVFRSKDDKNHFMVKRVIGLPGDLVEMKPNGFISINGEPFEYQEGEKNEDFIEYRESNGHRSYTVRYSQSHHDHSIEEKVPQGQIFLMGDNRDHSMDSRFWGGLPLNKILGRVTYIWMSCEENDEVSSFLCQPEYFRMERLFKKVR